MRIIYFFISGKNGGIALLRRMAFIFTLSACLWFFYIRGFAPVMPTSWLAGITGAENKGFLVYLQPDEGHTLDPLLAGDYASNRILVNIYEGLVRLQAGSPEPEPCLATRWEVSRDGLEWTFYLRSGVTFQDGTPFNAEAVKFNFERIVSGQNNSPYASFVFGMVQRVEVLNPSTVRFTLKYPYSPFLYNLAMPVAAMVSPAAVAKYKDDFWQHRAGTGPFIFKQWEKNKEIILQANAEYWGVKPAVPGVIFRTIPDAATRKSMLLSGAAHISEGISTAEIPSLQQKGFQVVSTPGLDLSYLGFYTNKGLFRNRALREIACQACDPRALAEELFPGEVITAAGPLPPRVLASDQTPERPQPNPEKARRDLISAGYGQGLPITLLAYSNARPYNPAGGEKLARVLAEQLNRAGFQCAIKVYPWEDFKKALLRQEGDAFIYGWTGDNGDPDNFLYTLFSSAQINSGLNATRYRNQEVDTLLQTARRTADDNLRSRIYRDVLLQVHQDVPMVFLHHSVKTLVTAGNIQGTGLQGPQRAPYLGRIQIIKNE
ncbi:ABC transporter substrate-binding protein [Desulfofundulus thermobenzoicus]|uniref:ABC transporter substrate-binding protein n=1 Tax=Desulfofundulus thermobenzoicus TaxID=29376 RepID=A0A6N7IQJ9_9FIRM|nr:ABC transporter substrate-binding protein [Desulfofundulus thermobenzoicus]MQL52355.1 ABC transporter substrate-binding protein [Desulfofundulus thermobenzoicus]